MASSIKTAILRFLDWAKHRYYIYLQNSTSNLLPFLEPLEPRVLLSGDLVGLDPIDFLEDDREPVIDVDLVPGAQGADQQASEVPELPGLELVDPDLTKLARQVIYLDFHGASEVVYEGPVMVGPFDVPAFVAYGEFVGQEEALIDQIVVGVEEAFDGLGIVFTTDKPAHGSTYSTVYIGGDDRAFTEYGTFLGLAEQVDIGNEDASDTAFVFSDQLSTQELTDVITHEVGHLLGYKHVHEYESADASVLASLAAAPTLTTFSSVLGTTLESTPIEITFSDIAAQGDEADSDGTVEAFIINSVSSGQLGLGTSPENMSPWDSESNDVVTSSINAYWVPATDATGTLDAFTVIAVDNNNEESSPAITAQIQVIEDTTAPGTVSDLSHSNVTTTSVTLTWTAPANNGTEAQSGAAAEYEVRYATSAIDDETAWSNATTVNGESQPQPVTSTESFAIPGLTSNTTYHFALKTKDYANNWSALSNSYSVATEADGGVGDSTAPAAVTNLSHTNVTSSSVQLTWTAPADDGSDAGSGAATEYDIRYALSAIDDEAKWNDANTVDGETSPLAASNTENFGVFGLDPNTTYHFALKTRDEANNWSDLSNSYSVTTTESFGMMMGPNQPLDAIALDNLHTEGSNLEAITVDILVPNGSGFDPTTHLAALSTGSDSGVSLYKDNKTTGAGQGWLDPPENFNDTPLTLASTPTWSQPSSGVYRTTLTLETADAVPDAGDSTGSDYFIIIQTSESPVPGDSFKVQIPAGGITIDSGSAFGSAYPAAPQAITIAQGGQMGSAVMISEVQLRGGADNDEFIELYNRRDFDVDLSSYSLQYCSGLAEVSSSNPASKINLSGMIQANGYLLIAPSSGYDGGTAADITYNPSTDFNLSHEGGTLFLVDTQDALVFPQSGTIQNRLAWGSASGSGALYPEGSAAPAPADNGSLERKAFSDSTLSSMASGGIDASMGNSYTSDNNQLDFITRTTSEPQNSNSSTESSELSGNFPVVINEFLYNGDTQWIELYNNSSSSVDLTGWTIEAAGKTYTLPSGASIDASGYVTVYWNQDGTNTSTAFYTGTSGWAVLPNLAGDIYLINAADAPQDYVQYGGAGQSNESDAASAGQWASGMFVDGTLYGDSLGRGTNGYDSNMVWDWQVFSSPSIGAANSGGDSFAPEPVTNVTLTDSDTESWGIDGGDVTVTWTPDSTADSSFDYYEIYLLQDGVDLDVYNHSPFETVFDGQTANSRTGSNWRMNDSANQPLETGDYKAYVRAVDFAQNRSAAIASAVATLTSENDSGQLPEDTMSPMIMSMPINNAKAGADTVFFAQVHDDRSVAGAALRWRVSGGGSFNTVNATALGPAGAYKMTLPWDNSWDTSTQIEYYFTAWDDKDNDLSLTNHRYFTASPAFDMSPDNEDNDSTTLTGAENSAFVMNFKDASAYTRTISGTVYNSSGSALENAFVFIPGSGLDAVQSDSNGAYSFSGNVADGSYDLIAMISGYGDLNIPGVMVHSGMQNSTGNDFYMSTGGGGRGGDSQKAFVMWTEPGEGMMGAPTDISSSAAPIVAHLSEAMDASSINDHNAADAGSNIYLTTTGQDRIAGQVTYDDSNPGDPKIIFSSDTALNSNTTYRWIMTSGVKDAAGNAIEPNQPDGSWAMEFTTFANFEVGGTFEGDGYSMTVEYGKGMGYPPYVTGSMPSPGAFNVPTNSKITVTFSESMDATTIEATNSTGTGLRLYDTNYNNSGIGEYIPISVDLDDATRTVATITPRVDDGGWQDALLQANHHYTIRVMGSAKNSTGITMADPSVDGYADQISYQSDFDTASGQDTTAPQIMGLNLEMYRNGSGDITSSGTIVDVPTTMHTIEIGFDKNMDPATITRNNITLKRGTTLISGTVNYRPLDRMATFSPSTALAPSSDYTLQVSTNVQDLTGQAIASDYYAVFTTSDQVDSEAPFVNFATGSDYMLAVTFNEPMNAAKKTNATKWDTSVLNPANYTLWEAYSPPPHTIGTNLLAYTGNGLESSDNGDMAQASGVTIKYDIDSFTATLEGLQLPTSGGFMVFVNDVTDISGNTISGNVAPPPDAGFASAYGLNAMGGPIEDSADMGKMMVGGMGMTGAGGQGMDMHMMGMTPTEAMPMSMLAGATTTYMVDIPLTTAIPAGGKIVLTFPSGFNVSGAKNADPNGDYIHGDINGPGQGTVVLSGATETSGGLADDGITVNEQARTVTITLGDVGTQENDYLSLDIAGIVNSKLPKSFDTSGYTIGIKTMANGSVLETMSNVMPFFLMPGGDYKISGNITFPEAVTGTVSLFGGSPQTGPIEQEITFSNTDTVTYEIANLPAGEYFIMTDPMVTMGGSEYFGSGSPEPIWIDNSDATKNFTFSAPDATFGLDVEITGDFNAAQGKDSDVDIFAHSAQGFAVKTVTLDQDYTSTSFTTTLYLPRAGRYSVGIGPAMPKGPMMTDGPAEMKFTPPPDIRVEVDSEGNWKESNETANDGTVNFTVGTSLTITGYVKKSATDTVANAEVYAYSPQGMFGTYTKSAKDGAFSLNLPEGMYNAGAMIPGMPPSIETVFEVRDVDGTPTIYVEGRTATEVFGSNELIIKLNQPERTISGKVTDGTNVVANAPVWAYQTDGPGHADTMTDSSGNFILYVNSGNWNIGTYVPGFGDLDEKSGIAVTNEDVANVNFAPDTSATYVTISGNVSIGSVAQTNMPIRAVEINSDGTFSGYQAHGHTDSNGDYTIKVKGNDGADKHYRVDIWTPEYGEVAANAGAGLSQEATWDQPWNVAVTTSNVADVDIVVETADLTTLTIDFSGGTADMQAYVDLMQIDPTTKNPIGTGRHFEVTDLSSSTTVDLPAGAYYAFAHIPGYGDYRPTESESDPFYLDLTSGSPTATFDLSAISVATVSGTVRDDSNNPVADAHVHIGNADTGIYYDTTTGSDGTYSLTMGAGTYFTGAEKKGYISEPKQITINAGSNPNMDLTMSSTSLKITGYVYVDQDGGTDGQYDAGEEITDAFVSAKQIASSDKSGGFAGVSTDLDGSYELYVSAGEWQVFAVADEYEEATYGSNPITISTADVTGINIRLSEAVTLAAPKNSTFKPAQGTTFDHPDAGLKVTMPPNSIGTDSTDYKVAAAPTSKLPTTTSASVIGGKGQDITVNDSSGAAVTTLSDSITIEQTFTKAELVEAGITTLEDVEKIVMAYWDESASAYKALPTTIAYNPASVTDFADLVSVTYTGSTEHLSVFAPILPKDGLAPSPPTSVAATAGSNQVSLTWTAPTTNTDSSTLTDLLGYEIYRSSTEGGTYTQVNTSDVTTNSYTDSTAVDGTTYYYKVTAADTGGNESAKSSVSNAATPVSDTIAPTITSVTSTTTDGSYNAGDNVNITLTFSEAVTLSGGNLVVTLETGDTDRTVTISSINSSTTATGTYTVQAGDTSTDLTVKTIALSAGTLSDGADNAMSVFTPVTNLAAGSALVVVTTTTSTLLIIDTSQEVTQIQAADSSIDPISTKVTTYKVPQVNEQTVWHAVKPVVEAQASELVETQGESDLNNYTYVAAAHLSPTPSTSTPQTQAKVADVSKQGTSKSLSSRSNMLNSAVNALTTVTTLMTFDATPELSGTVADPAAKIEVTVNGQTYQAINNGDGSWTLADNTVAPLPEGVHDVEVKVTDSEGNVTTKQSENAITIQNKKSDEDDDQKNKAGLGILIPSVFASSLVSASIAYIRRRWSKRSLR